MSHSLLLPEHVIVELERINSCSNKALISGQQFLIDPRKFTFTRREIPRSEATRDVSWLFQLLSTFYAGWGPLAETAGVNWMVLRERLETKIQEASDPLPLEDWQKLLAEAFEAVPDGHLALITNSLTSEGIKSEYHFAYRSGLPQVWSLPQESYDEAQRMGLFPISFHHVVDENRVLASTCIFASSVESLGQLRNSAALLEMPEAAIKLNAEIDLPLITRGPGWTYVRWDCCSWSNKANSELFATAESTNDSDTVVVDLRGNSGGDEAVFGRWLELLGAESVQYEYGIELQSPLIPIWNVNACLLGLATEVARRKPLPDYSMYLSNYAEASENLLKQLGETSVYQQIPWDMGRTAHPKTKKFHGRLIGLTDRRTLSAGESAARMIRQVPGSILMGTNTGGKRIVSCNAFWLMPYSRLLFVCGRVWTTSLLADKRFREGSGLLPDLYWNIPPLKFEALIEQVLNFSSNP